MSRRQNPFTNEQEQNKKLLVIMSVKIRRSDQYSILLTSLAETNLLVGAVSQPSYIVGQIYLRRGQVYLSRILPYHRAANLIHLMPIFASLLHQTLLSSLISGAREMNDSKYTQGAAKQKLIPGVRAYFIYFILFLVVRIKHYWRVLSIIPKVITLKAGEYGLDHNLLIKDINNIILE